MGKRGGKGRVRFDAEAENDAAGSAGRSIAATPGSGGASPQVSPGKTPASHLRPLSLAEVTAPGMLLSPRPGSASTPVQLFTARKGVLDSMDGGLGSTARRCSDSANDGAWGMVASASGMAVAGVTGPREESIKVVVRIRPASDKEAADGDGACLQHTGRQTLTLMTASEPAYHTFDYVAGPDSTQEQLFKVGGLQKRPGAVAVVEILLPAGRLASSASQPPVHVQVVGRPMAENALAGFNSTVLAYGQVGR